jgi:hypothetical protein
MEIDTLHELQECCEVLVQAEFMTALFCFCLVVDIMLAKSS